jgi:proteasome-associated ATPase
VLLHGPSGCGKSLLGKAVASAVAAPHGGKGAQSAFIYVKGPEIIERWVGSSEANVRALFDQARQHRRKHGYPAVIFIDEAEAVLGHRGGGMHLSSGGTMSQTVVPAFLAEMDGLEESSAFVLLATNLPTALDPAVVRDGRIDRKIHVGRPDRDTARDIFALHLRGRPGPTKALAEAGADALYDPARVMFHLVMQSGAEVPIALSDVASGAMIEGVVGRATQSAIRRELETGKAGKLSAEDLAEAVARTQDEVADLDHTATLAEAGHDVSKARGIRRAPRAAA